MYTLRFNLGRGENFEKWKLTNPNGFVSYFCPKKTSFKMHDCKVKIRENASNKIFNGSNKFPCSWIECKDVEVLEKVDYEYLEKFNYNPRLNPNWLDSIGNIINNKSYKTLVTIEDDVFRLID